MLKHFSLENKQKYIKTKQNTISSIKYVDRTSEISNWDEVNVFSIHFQNYFTPYTEINNKDYTSYILTNIY